MIPTSGPNLSYRVLALVGESSGDKILSQLIESFAQSKIEITWKGLGGEHSLAKGMTSVYPLGQLSVQGLTDALRIILRTLWVSSKFFFLFKSFRPHAIVFVDYPGLNSLLLRFFKKKIPSLTIAPPQAWAYQKKNLQVYKHSSIHILFERDLPFYQTLARSLSQGHFFSKPTAYRPLAPYGGIKEKNKDNRTLLLCPGSRLPTFKRNLKLYLNAAHQFGLYHPSWDHAILMPPNLNPRQMQGLEQKINSLWNIKNRKKTPQIIKNFQLPNSLATWPLVLTFPGTFTLELALKGLPFLVLGQVDKLTYWYAHQKLKVKTTVLPQLLDPNFRVPEYIQTDPVFTKEALYSLLSLAKETPPPLPPASCWELYKHLGPSDIIETKNDPQGLPNSRCARHLLTLLQQNQNL